MPLFSFLTETQNSFEGKKDYEQVILLLRRHWFVIALRLFALGIVALLPVVASLFFSHTDYFWLTISVFYLFWWYAVFYEITMYLLDVWIVTDHRIIDSQQHGFFRRTVAEINLSKIQDISVAIGGVIPTFLDYGNLEVQSAAATEKFFFLEIPHPNRVRDIIMEAHNEFIETHPNETEIHEMGPMNLPT